jgi:hypothetical protein
MENTEKINEIILFLNKNYHVKESKYFNRLDEHEWGLNIIELLNNVFNHGLELTETTFHDWAINQGVLKYEDAHGPRKLKASWSPEMANNLGMYGVVDAEAQLIALLSEEISREIDAQILQDLRGQIKTTDEFFNIVKCVGYETSPTIYDPYTFVPKRFFVSAKQDVIENERQNNTHWQNWVRARRQN